MGSWRGSASRVRSYTYREDTRIVRHTQDVKSPSHIALQLRQLRGFESQAAFAKRLGISRDSLANYETGRTVPSVEKLDKFCDALGLPLAFFQEDALAQLQVNVDLALGMTQEYGRRPSPDELAFLRLMRAVPQSTILEIATRLLEAISNGSSLVEERDGEKLRQAVESVAAVIKSGGKYDNSRPKKAGADALRQALELAREALNRRD